MGQPGSEGFPHHQQQGQHNGQQGQAKAWQLPGFAVIAMLVQKRFLRVRRIALADQLDPQRSGDHGGRQGDNQAIDDHFADIGTQHAMHGHQRHGQGHAQVQKIDSGFFRDHIDQRNQQNKTHFKEHRDAGYESYEHHGPGGALLTQRLEQCLSDALGAA